jgi:MFS transporter, DHA1 family, quinolone resistance protein
MNALVRRYALVNASMAALFGLSMPIMYLALMEKGISLGQIGTLMAAFTISTMLFEVPFGALADTIGRKRVFLLGEAVMLLATVGMWLAGGLWALCVVMVLNGMSRALLSGSLDALMVEQLRETGGQDGISSAEILAAQAKVGGLSALSLGIAAIVGGFLPMWLAGTVPAWLSVRYYEVNFMLMVPLIAAHLVLTAALIRERRPAAGDHPADRTPRSGALLMLRALGTVRRSPTMLKLMAIQVIGGAALAAIDIFWQPRLGEFIDARDGSWLFGLLCSISFIAMSFGHKIAARLAALFRHSYMRLLLVLQVAMGAVIILFAMQQGVYGFFAAYTLLYLIVGAMAAPMLTVLHENADDAMRSTLLSMKSLFQQLGALFGALTGAAIAQSHGINVAWLSMGVAVLVGCALFIAPVALRRRAPSSSIGTEKTAS